MNQYFFSACPQICIAILCDMVFSHTVSILAKPWAEVSEAVAMTHL